MAQHNQFGKYGEELAAKHLLKNGYKILHCNWSFGKGEIDIIAEKDNRIIFVEVKTRSTTFFGEPLEFVTKKKQNHIIKAANEYIFENDIQIEARFDIISIVIDGKINRIEHIEDAFYPLA